jgi:predicted transcriptional regulator
MQLTIQLDPESARQLAIIQQQTNQDQMSVIQQGIGLYHQQMYPHYLARMEVPQVVDLYSATAGDANSDR